MWVSLQCSSGTLMMAGTIFQIAKFMGSTWGPPGSCRPQMGPMLAPWTLLSGILIWEFCLIFCIIHAYPFQVSNIWQSTNCFVLVSVPCPRLLLAKIFNFCKYVRLSVCYLPKFSILASMFVWRFVCPSVCYLPKFSILQVCSFDRLSVCLSVCLSVTSSIQVTVFDISLPNLTQVCIYVTWPCL